MPFGLFYRLDKCFSCSIELYLRVKYILEKIIKKFHLKLENSFCLFAFCLTLVKKEKHLSKIIFWNFVKKVNFPDRNVANWTVMNVTRKERRIPDWYGLSISFE